MGNSAAERAFQRARLKKKQKGEVAQLFERALTLHELGRLPDAMAVYRQLLRLEPNHFNALYLLGRLESSAQGYHEAEALLAQAVQADPRSADAHFHLGVVLSALERFEDARASYQQAVALKPNDPLALNNLGTVCRNLNRPQEAIDCYDKAIAIKSNSAEIHHNRGLVLLDLARYEEALTSFDRALAINPRHADALSDRGNALYWLRRLAEALDSIDRAIELAPESARAWTNRAEVLLNLNRTSDAVASCERALALSGSAPTPQAVFILGRCLAQLGQVNEAIASFDMALAMEPGFELAISNKIFALDFAEDASFESHCDARRTWWEQIGTRIPASPRHHHPNDRNPDRRLVLGYVSSDFRWHSAALAFRPVLQHHDKARFEVVCYSCSPRVDSATEQFRQMADRWRDASQWSDERLDAQIREDGIDILIDLSGHTNGNRLGVFVRKPAPVQVHAWGNITPPGLPTIDYVLADPVSIPPHVRHLFCETIYDLPCILTVDPLPPGVPHAETPALANGFVTFGVFNRVNKISEAAAALWSRILARVPQAKLLIKHSSLDDPAVQGNLLVRFARYGVPAERIELMGGSPRADHLAALNRVDISLDPFPQNGGASTWESLQMGVPVVAKLGNAQASRAAGAILTTVGMPDWVARSDEEYIEIAVARASQIAALVELRRALPARIAASTAGNPARYTEAVESAYRTMWRTYCAKSAG